MILSKHCFNSPWLTVFDYGAGNTLDAFIPELWAQESLQILQANMVATNLIHRDFSNEIAKFGDVVNTRRPAEFTARRKVDDDTVTVQDSIATNVAVPLNQHQHTSFMIRDGEEAKGFKKLRDEYLYPAMLSMAQILDEITLCQVYQYFRNAAGQIGTAATANTIIEAREVLNTNKAPMMGRNLIVTASQEADLLAGSSSNLYLVTAEKVGDEGTALREGSLGRKFGFDIFMCQNAPNPTSTCEGTETLMDVDGAQTAPDTTIVVTDEGCGLIEAGQWCTIAGDNTPQLITAVTGDSTPTLITIYPGIKHNISNDATITIMEKGTTSATEAIGTHDALAFNAFTTAASVGQLISVGAVGTTVECYGVINSAAPTTTALHLDRPLESAITQDTELVGIGPPGNYGFAFHKNALAMISRPLATPEPGTGAKSYVANYEGLAIRTTITYDGRYQGHLVTVDLLCGYKLLDVNLGCLFLT